MSNQPTSQPRNLTFSERMTATLMAGTPDSLNQIILKQYEAMGQPISPAIIEEANRQRAEIQQKAEAKQKAETQHQEQSNNKQTASKE
jgi:hypothetical protein